MRITPFQVIGIFLLSIVGFGIFSLMPQIEALILKKTLVSPSSRESVSSVSFHLTEDNWLSFSLPRYKPSVKFVFNAVIKEGVEIPVYDPLRYAVQYEFIDNAGKAVYEGTYHFESSLTRYYDSTLKKFHTAWFFLDPSSVPVDPNTALFNLDSITKSITLGRLRLKKIDSRMSRVNTRVYVQQRVPLKRAQTNWKRLTFKKRQMLMRANVFGSEFASNTEKENVMQQHWEPLAPNGIASTDYVQEKLYRLFQPKGRIPSQEIRPDGLNVEKALVATIPIPPGGGEIELVFERTDSSDARYEIHWSGSRFNQRKTFSFISKDILSRFKNSFAEGILEIHSSVHSSVSAYLMNASGTLDITPPRLLLRPYILKTNLDFEVLHLKQSETTFRLDIRVPGAIYQDNNNIINISLLGKDARELKSFSLPLQNLSTSVFERLHVAEGFSSVSEPQRFYFRLTPKIKTIRINSSKPNLLLSAYNRAESLNALKTRVPLDYSRYNQLQSGKRQWHLVSAKNHRELFNSTAILEVRTRPPENNLDLLAGRYKFELFQPKGNWRGRYLFVPHEGKFVDREHTRTNLYHRIRQEIDEDLVFAGNSLGNNSLRPQLVYLNKDKKPFTLKLLLNGETYLNRSLSAGTHAVIQLPKIPSGKHRLRVESDSPNTLIYLNQIDSIREDFKKSDAFLKQIASHIGSQPLEYTFNKQSAGEEVLAFNFFHFLESKTPTNLNVELLGAKKTFDIKTLRNTPQGSFTTLRRVFEIEPSLASDVFVFDANNKKVQNGQRFFMKLGEDLKPGSYTMVVRRLNGPAGYLRMSRITPGLHEESRFIRKRRATENR